MDKMDTSSPLRGPWLCEPWLRAQWLRGAAAVGLVGQHKFDVFPFGGLRIDPADVVDRCADIVFAQVISQLAGAGKIGGIAGAQRELGQPSIPGGTEHLGRRIVRLPGRLRPNADID